MGREAMKRERVEWEAVCIMGRLGREGICKGKEWEWAGGYVLWCVGRDDTYRETVG